MKKKQIKKRGRKPKNPKLLGVEEIKKFLEDPKRKRRKRKERNIRKKENNDRKIFSRGMWIEAYIDEWGNVWDHKSRKIGKLIRGQRKNDMD